jgi:alpha-galactosidase
VFCDDVRYLRWKVAGINHQAWLLEVRDGEKDLYPRIKERSRETLAEIYRLGGGRAALDEMRARATAAGVANDGPARVKYYEDRGAKAHAAGHSDLDARVYMLTIDMVRTELMLQFGYYLTESSEHNSEYCPWFIRTRYPELIDRYNIPLDEYARRCVK